MTESKTAIIFDMDGVLVDSEAYYYERRKAFLAEFDLTIEGLTLPELVGADMRSLWQKIEQVNKKELDIAFLNEQGIETEPLRVDDFTGEKMTFFFDPDGLPLELHE